MHRWLEQGADKLDQLNKVQSNTRCGLKMNYQANAKALGTAICSTLLSANAFGRVLDEQFLTLPKTSIDSADRLFCRIKTAQYASAVSALMPTLLETVAQGLEAWRRQNDVDDAELKRLPPELQAQTIHRQDTRSSRYSELASFYKACYTNVCGRLGHMLSNESGWSPRELSRAIDEMRALLNHGTFTGISPLDGTLCEELEAQCMHFAESCGKRINQALESMQRSQMDYDQHHLTVLQRQLIGSSPGMFFGEVWWSVRGFRRTNPIL